MGRDGAEAEGASCGIVIEGISRASIGRVSCMMEVKSSLYWLMEGVKDAIEILDFSLVEDNSVQADTGRERCDCDRRLQLSLALDGTELCSRSYVSEHGQP